jgi:alkylated DNA repair protein alkB family protein 8
VYVWALEQKLDKVKREDLREVEFSGKSRENVGSEKISQTVMSIPKNEGEGSPLENRGMCADKNESAEDKEKIVQINEKREVFEQQDLFVPWKFRGINQDKKTKSNVSKSKEETQEHDDSVKQSQEDNSVKQSQEDNSSVKSTCDSHVFHRFYHVFKEGELLELCRQLENITTKDLFYDRGNWCALLEKTDNKS